MKLDGNVFRMPFAEWLCCLADADLDNGARIIAIYSAAFNIVGNDQLHQLTGIKSDKTIRRLKKMLLDGGWVIIGHQKGGRGYGVTISPAYKETPVSFTDVVARNPGKYNPGIYDKTPVEITETPVENTPVSQGRGFGETSTKSVAADETAVEITGVSTPTRAHARKRNTLTGINNTLGVSESAHARDVPHMNGKGFVISAKSDLYVPTEIVEAWRAKYTHIPDLEAVLMGLAAKILSKGIMHPGWQCPEGWMPQILADENQKFSDRAGEHRAREARASGRENKKSKFQSIVGRRYE